MASKDSTEKPTTSRPRRSPEQRAQESVSKAEKALEQATRRVGKATEKVNAFNVELNEAVEAQSLAQRQLDYAKSNPALPVEEPTVVPLDDAGTVTDSVG